MTFRFGAKGGTPGIFDAAGQTLPILPSTEHQPSQSGGEGHGEYGSSPESTRMGNQSRHRMFKKEKRRRPPPYSICPPRPSPTCPTPMGGPASYRAMTHRGWSTSPGCCLTRSIMWLGYNVLHQPSRGLQDPCSSANCEEMGKSHLFPVDHRAHWMTSCGPANCAGQAHNILKGRL